MNEKITFTAQEMQAESARCIEAQQARIQAILEMKKSPFGLDKDWINYQLATNNQRINELLGTESDETIREIAETNRILLHNLDLYNAEEYSYTDTL